VTDIIDRVAQALWIADGPWRQRSPWSVSVPTLWADADDGDRDLYRNKAKIVIEQLVASLADCCRATKDAEGAS
jgi:hypothetical protein